jgi:hypothetical protein
MSGNATRFPLQTHTTHQLTRQFKNQPLKRQASTREILVAMIVYKDNVSIYKQDKRASCDKIALADDADLA